MPSILTNLGPNSLAQKSKSSLLGRVVHEGAYVALVGDGVDAVDVEVGRVVLLGDAVQGNNAALEVVLEDAVGVPHLLVGERRRGEQIGLQARVDRASPVIHLAERWFIIIISEPKFSMLEVAHTYV